MKYYNVSNPSEKVDFKNVVMQSSNKNNGLYLPEHIPVLDTTFLKNINKHSFAEISFQVAKAILGADMPHSALQKTIDEALNFPIHLKNIHDDNYVLELFHGPTMAFKDVGARFMSGLVSYFIQSETDEINILVATSGDTGSAVAAAFLNKPGIKVTILYPSGRVSYLQEQQLTTMGNNITALEIDGSFDDCQSMVKSAFADIDLSKKLKLTSANSINFARLFPQSFYYFYAYSQIKNNKLPLVFSVPSGNFGNLTAGIIAQKMGLPIWRFVAATNKNNVIPEYLQTQKYNPMPSVATISSAMDVGNPSNFERINALYNHNFSEIKNNITGYAFSDFETCKAIKTALQKHKYLLEPHGAVAYLGISRYLEKHKCCSVFFETAHPAKFSDVLQSALNIDVPVPEELKHYLGKKKRSIKMSADFEQLKEYLLSSN
jgi:threonine synthase